MHIFLNWGPILHYMRNKRREVQLFHANFLASFLISSWVLVGTLLAAPPFSWVLDAGAAIKDAASRTYGEPPYAHAELSTFGQFTRALGIDPARAAALLA